VPLPTAPPSPLAPLALVRPVSDSLADCELSHLERVPIDVGRAREQHGLYVDLLAELGCTIEWLPAAPGSPDAVFVEDTAVVVDEVAVMARPGAASRRGEIDAVAAALAGRRPLARIEAPGTLDGGDVLRVGKRVFVGRSARTDDGGRDQLRAILEPYGYSVEAVTVTGCLHLKSAVTEVADGTLLLHPDWLDPTPFAGLDLVAVDPAEPFAANALRLGATVVLPAAFPRTRRRLEAHGLAVRTVPADELAKAEGGVTCCSIFVDSPAGPGRRI